jgi:Na+-transporting NADH:ubiquinone oxidoreductase subunit A
MALHKIEKGLDLPISGRPLQVVRGSAPCTRVGVMADDFPGMKPRMHVEEGQTVARGQVLFEDRKQPGVLHTAPAAGRVIAINRGEKRALQSVVIDLSDGERAGSPRDDEFATFENYTGAAPTSLSGDQVRALLVESGLWTAIRERPFSKVPSPEGTAAALFITATDTNPLAPIPEVVLENQRGDFRLGIELLAKLLDGPTAPVGNPGTPYPHGEAREPPTQRLVHRIPGRRRGGPPLPDRSPRRLLHRFDRGSLRRRSATRTRAHRRLRERDGGLGRRQGRAR